MKKKMICLLLSCLMLVPLAASAEETTVSTANAVAECVNTYEITAPFSGVVEPFTWRGGDRVKASDVLFELETVKVYAPETGTLQGLFAEEGDLCEDVIAQYGMIASIEKEEVLVINATTSGRYASDENMILHLGSTVYFEQSNDTDNTGEGRIVALNGNAYTVELTAGEFDPDDSVKIYRDEKMGSKTCIGTGTLVRGADAAVQGSGRVLKSYFKEGQKVQKGQLMFELAPSGTDTGVSSGVITAGRDGVLAEPKVVSGQQVYKGQSLVTLQDLSALQVVAEVDEVDLDKVHIGDNLNLVFDRYPDTEISGTVTQIAGIGVKKQNATYYNVEIVFSTSLEVLPGMNATVYLP